MHRDTMIALVSALLCTASVDAAVRIGSTSIDTPGLPGYKTWSVMAFSDHPITAIDFVGDGSNDPATGRGFFGTMNQLTPPGALSTVFQDANVLIPILPGANEQQDSQFSVRTAGVVVPPGLAEESGTLMQAAWAWPTPQGTSVPFAQIVIPPTNTAGVYFRGAITALVNGVQTDFNVSGKADFELLVPVITPVHLGEIEQTAPILVNVSPNGPPSTWGGLMPVAGSPAIPATLTPQGHFSWDPTGSARGPKGNGVLYSWSATRTSVVGSTTGLVLTLSLIPEPATLVMCVIMVCFPCRRFAMPHP